MNIPDLSPEHRLNKVVSFVWRGLHNAPKIKKEPLGNGREMWELNTSPLATFDFDELTRLVLAAHEYAVRAEVAPSGPGALRCDCGRVSARARCMSVTHRFRLLLRRIVPILKPRLSNPPTP